MKTIRLYNTVASENLHSQKHIPPANKEWKNSVYSYNKNILKDTSLKDENTYDTMKSYLNSSFYNPSNKKSMRMRSYIKRSSTKKVFVSKPEIKQTTNKAIITLYIFDRESQLFKSNLFMINKFLKKTNTFFKKSSHLNGNYLLKNIHGKKININENIKGFWKIRNILLKKHLVNYKTNYNLLPKIIMPYFINKQLLLKDLFIYSFLKWILEKSFGLTLNKYKCCNICKKENLKKTHCTNCGRILTLFSTKLVLLRNEKELLSINNFKLQNIKKLNIILSKYLNNYLSKLNYKDKFVILDYLFINFQKNKNILFIKNILKREYNVLDIFANSNFNNYKNTVLLSRIKNYIGSVFSKKVEFNLVNLKYLHLNTDILMEAIATKLRKKLSLLGVLKRSLFLIKRPSKFSGMIESSESLNKRKLSQIPYNKLYSITKNRNSSLNNYNFNTIDNIVNSLKYKWISGIKLEAKGRLTKRYTASRAVYKFVTKGNLKNLDKFYNTEFDLATPNVHLIRNQFKPNLQHTYVYSHKRIGTFGLKGWINSV